MIVNINRIEKQEATIGTIEVSGRLLGFTLERPWNGNKRNISCIPIGSYICKKHDSPTFGKVYKVCDVFGRSNILFHKGNVIDDTSGCILIGKSTGYLEGKRAVISSGVAFNEFMNDLEDVEEFKLVIK